MPSRNEVYAAIGKTLPAEQIGQSDTGTMFVRFGEQVFQITVEEKTQFKKAPDGEAARFMETLPHPIR